MLFIIEFMPRTKPNYGPMQMAARRRRSNFNLRGQQEGGTGEGERERGVITAKTQQQQWRRRYNKPFCGCAESARKWPGKMDKINV